VFASQTVGYPVEICFFADIVFAKGAVVVVCLAENAALVAPNVLPGQPICAMSARVTMVASARTFTNFELSYLTSDGLYNTDTLMQYRTARTPDQ
jgi:hypothetical protein